MRARNQPVRSLSTSNRSEVNNASKKAPCCNSLPCAFRNFGKWSILPLLITLAFVSVPTPRLDALLNLDEKNDASFNPISISQQQSLAVFDGPTSAPLTSVIEQNQSSSCVDFRIPPAKEKECLMSYLSTFPGSGSELCLELIEGLTGIQTGHAYPFLVNNSQTQKVVVLKTHYPNKIVRGGHPSHNPVFVTRAILLLRNPMHALPSFFNFIKEQESQQRRHTQQAPLEEWIAWRDDDFPYKLYQWRFHLDFWLSQHHLLPHASYAISETDALHKKRGNKTMILVRYENLIHPSKGPPLLQEMSTFLQQNENVTAAIPPEQVPCLWDYIVNQRSAKKRTGSNRYIPPFRNEQLNEIVQMLRLERSRYQSEYPQLDAILKEYLKSVQDRLRQQQQGQRMGKRKSTGPPQAT